MFWKRIHGKRLEVLSILQSCCERELLWDIRVHLNSNGKYLTLPQFCPFWAALLSKGFYEVSQQKLTYIERVAHNRIFCGQNPRSLIYVMTMMCLVSLAMAYALMWIRCFWMGLLSLHIIWPGFLMSQPTQNIPCRSVLGLIRQMLASFTLLETAHSNYKLKKTFQQSQLYLLKIRRKDIWLMAPSWWIVWDSSNDICQKLCVSSFRFFFPSIYKDGSSGLRLLVISI